MGRHNFKDQLLIKRQCVGQKKNVMNEKLNDGKKQNKHRNLLLLTTRSYVCFQSSRVHIKMNAKSAIEKLQIIVKEEEAQKSEHKQRQEEETKLLRKKKKQEKS